MENLYTIILSAVGGSIVTFIIDIFTIKQRIRQTEQDTKNKVLDNVEHIVDIQTKYLIEPLQERLKEFEKQVKDLKLELKNSNDNIIELKSIINDSINNCISDFKCPLKSIM